MNELIAVGNKTLYLVLLLSALPVLVATLVGLAIGLFQTVTQLQEQTLPFGAKMLAVVLTVVVLIDWLSGSMLDFAVFTLAKALAV